MGPVGDILDFLFTKNLAKLPIRPFVRQTDRAWSRRPQVGFTQKGLQLSRASVSRVS